MSTQNTPSYDTLNETPSGGEKLLPGSRKVIYLKVIYRCRNVLTIHLLGLFTLIRSTVGSEEIMLRKY